MIDISMTGATIDINGNGLSVKGINEFASDGNPIAVSDTDVADGDMNLNGILVTWYKPTPIRISFTLIPGSDSEQKINTFLTAVHIGGKGSNVADAYIKSLTITAPCGNDNSATNSKGHMSWTFLNGRLLSGPLGQGTNNEGREDSKTYTFIFESISSQSNKKKMT